VYVVLRTNVTKTGRDLNAGGSSSKRRKIS
jgi:hypothetical protein